MNKKSSSLYSRLSPPYYCCYCGAVNKYLQGIYLWIAKLENTARGINGITEASRLKIMNDAVHHFAILKKVCYALLFITLLFFCLDRKRRLD